MSFPRGTLTYLVISLILTAELANGFAKFDINLLLLELDTKKVDLSQLEVKWIDQPLDHFDPSEKRTFKMRYFESSDLWQPGGPIIIFVGGEAAASPQWVGINERTLNGQLACDTDGALFATEHRYYGESNPGIPNNNLTEYYKFLSSQQALADVANFIKFLKSDPKYKTSKVVAIGGSYAGNLAAWMRELYPELVDAAVAASAPVLAKKDFKEFYDTIAYTLGKYGGQKCLDDLERSYKRYGKLLKSSDGIETFKRELYICPSNDLKVLENQQLTFTGILYNYVARRVQYGTISTVKKLCNSTEPKHKLMADLNLLKQARSIVSDQVDCYDVDFNAYNFTDPWTYQFCSEFGYLQTTTSEKEPFVHWAPLEFQLKFCKDLIKEDREKRIDAGVARTNQMYGGKRPNVTKVVFTNGDMDPWHALEVLEALGPEAPATVVNGTSHCAVLIARDDEPEELTENREYVKNLIKKWISTP